MQRLLRPHTPMDGSPRKRLRHLYSHQTGEMAGDVAEGEVEEEKGEGPRLDRLQLK